MASPKKINLGVFAAGEIPYPIEHTFKVNGVAIDLTVWSAFVVIEGPNETGTYGAGQVLTDEADEGKITYVVAEADMQDTGKYRMLIWVEDGVNRFASDLILFEVYDGPGPTPT